MKADQIIPFCFLFHSFFQALILCTCLPALLPFKNVLTKLFVFFIGRISLDICPALLPSKRHHYHFVRNVNSQIVNVENKILSSYAQVVFIPATQIIRHDTFNKLNVIRWLISVKPFSCDFYNYFLNLALVFIVLIK